MQDFIFYIKLGLNHVLDFAAYDHILFLIALTLPFTFKSWKKVILLATIFTIAHCLSLFLSVYGVLVMDVGLIEFLIPVTILGTALFNLIYVKSTQENRSLRLHIFATAFFGLIHGFGFSNYFNMLMAEEEEKLGSLLGFATGIEIAQVLIVLVVLAVSYVFLSVVKVKSRLFITIASILVILITIPMLIATFPW
ncbi:HupE/UreJ family protein [Maribacter algarum]|uniref:HupE/UreJ family protein n=1 Tax=Maribacter algarum (ex Zhang et al. 2020) TaxID=2578118 RepID=A0A5S3PZL6_9FLAO|nr:HupE/UreJ family protein [Maribacter algarum]TMM58767.1 HupE/UreJ family protein [Maribacter algarum]